MSKVFIFQQGVQPTGAYAGCGDTYLKKNGPDQNNGASGVIQLLPLASASFAREGLISFDITEIPTNFVVDSAFLSLWADSGSGPGRINSAHQGKNAWIEGTKDNAPATAGEPTWNNRAHPATAWGAAGGLAGTDYESVAEDSVEVDVDDAWYQLDITNMARDWHANSSNNFGTWLIRTGGTNSNNVFVSSEGATTSERPYLTVTGHFDPRAKVGRTLADGSTRIGGGLTG